MLVELCAGLVLVEQGKLELLHLLKVVVEDELLGECGVEVVDGSFCPVVLAEAGKRGSEFNPSQAAGNHCPHADTDSVPGTWPVTWTAAVSIALSSQRRTRKHREVE